MSWLSSDVPWRHRCLEGCSSAKTRTHPILVWNWNFHYSKNFKTEIVSIWWNFTYININWKDSTTLVHVAQLIPKEPVILYNKNFHLHMIFRLVISLWAFHKHLVYTILGWNISNLDDALSLCNIHNHFPFHFSTLPIPKFITKTCKYLSPSPLLQYFPILIWSL